MQRPLIHQEEGPLRVATPRQAAHGLDAPNIRSSCPHSLTWRQREGERAWTICRVGNLTQPDAIRRGTSAPAVSPRILFGTTESRPLMKTVWNRPRLIKTIQGSLRGESHPRRRRSPLRKSRSPRPGQIPLNGSSSLDTPPVQTLTRRRMHVHSTPKPLSILRRRWTGLTVGPGGSSPRFACSLCSSSRRASSRSNSTGRRTHGRPGIRPRPPATALKPTRLPTYLYRCWPANNARPPSRTREIWHVWS